jgi:hypothetical protein
MIEGEIEMWGGPWKPIYVPRDRRAIGTKLSERERKKMSSINDKLIIDSGLTTCE